MPGGPWHIPDDDGRPYGLDVVRALCGEEGWGVEDLDDGRTGRVVWARLGLGRSGTWPRRSAATAARSSPRCGGAWASALVMESVWYESGDQFVGEPLLIVVR